MATYDVTGVGGTTGHPSNGRTPYMVENTINIAAINGDSGTAQNDVSCFLVNLLVPLSIL